MRLLAKTLVLAVAMTSSIGAAVAADLIVVDPIMMAPESASSWEGFYAGVTAGGTYISSGYFNLGAVAGVNFEVSPGIIVGVEGQLTSYFNGGYVGVEALAVGRLGAVVADDVLIYGTLGAGLLVDEAYLYQIGAGIEYAVSSDVSLRGEVAALGAFGNSPELYRATVGAIYHFN